MWIGFEFVNRHGDRIRVLAGLSRLAGVIRYNHMGGLHPWYHEVSGNGLQHVPDLVSPFIEDSVIVFDLDAAIVVLGINGIVVGAGLYERNGQVADSINVLIVFALYLVPDFIRFNVDDSLLLRVGKRRSANQEESCQKA